THSKRLIWDDLFLRIQIRLSKVPGLARLSGTEYANTREPMGELDAMQLVACTRVRTNRNKGSDVAVSDDENDGAEEMSSHEMFWSVLDLRTAVHQDWRLRSPCIGFGGNICVTRADILKQFEIHLQKIIRLDELSEVKQLVIKLLVAETSIAFEMREGRKDWVFSEKKRIQRCKLTWQELCLEREFTDRKRNFECAPKARQTEQIQPNPLKFGAQFSLRDGVQSLRDGVQSLRDGVQSLRDGVQSLRDGVQSLRDGVQSLRDGVQSLRDGVQSLRDGVQSLRDGVQSLRDGVQSLRDGVQSLRDGVQSLRDGVQSLRDGVQSLRDGVQSLRDGVQSLRDGVQSLRDGVQSLRDGVQSLRDGVQSLRDGVQSLRDGVQSLRDGVQSLRDGVQSLRDGSFSCNTLPVPSCHAARGKHEG
ncbi:hypothetical protein CLF_113084, partial [Clonorchis sinensis]